MHMIWGGRGAKRGEKKKKRETATRELVQSQANEFLLVLSMFQLDESLQSSS